MHSIGNPEYIGAKSRVSSEFWAKRDIIRSCRLDSDPKTVQIRSHKPPLSLPPSSATTKRETGLEPATNSLEGCDSSHLSYSRLGQPRI